MFNLEGKNLIILVLAVLCVALAGGFAYFQFGEDLGLNKGFVSPEKAKEMVLNYVNKIILQGRLEAKIAGQIDEERGLYKFQLEIGAEKFDSYLTKDGGLFFPQAIDIAAASLEAAAGESAQEKYTIGNFSKSGDELCEEEGKPIVYFFGSKGCPHCTWEHPLVEEVAAKFGGFISFHNNMDTSDDGDIFSKYSSGGIPTTVLGCKYFRVGSGEQLGKEEETKVLTALICDLTKGQPADVCEQVQELIDEING